MRNTIHFSLQQWNDKTLLKHHRLPSQLPLSTTRYTTH